MDKINLKADTFYISKDKYYKIFYLLNQMTYFDKKESSRLKGYIQEVESQNRAFELEKETVFKEASGQINYLVRQLNRLAGAFEEKNVEVESLERGSGNWTASTSKSKEKAYKTREIIVKSENNEGYSDQTIRQKLDQVIQREIVLEQKIQLFIRKNGQRKQKLQQLFQTHFQIKQRDLLIQQLQSTLKLEKQKFKTQLQAEIAQSKLQKNKIESHYQQKNSLLKLQYEQKTLQNIQKFQSILQQIQTQKNQTLSLMQQELSALQKNYQPKIQQNKIRSPSKTRKIGLQYDIRFQNKTHQKPLTPTPQKQKAQINEKLKTQEKHITDEKLKTQEKHITDEKLKTQEKHITDEKLKIANQKIHEFQGNAHNFSAQIAKLKDQNSKLTTKVECYQIKNKQQMNRIQEKEKFITNQSLELNKMAEELQYKNQAYLKLQKTVKSLEAKIANLTEELKRSKKANQEIRQMSYRNFKSMAKQLEDTKKEILKSKKTQFTLTTQLDSAKHQVKQKQIRIESINRQLERTKNYNEILTKENLSLNQVIENIGKPQESNEQRRVSKFDKLSLDELSSPRNIKETKNRHVHFCEGSKSLQNINLSLQETSTMHYSDTMPRINTHRHNRMYSESFTEENRPNSLGRQLILPLKESLDHVKSNEQQPCRSGRNQNQVFTYNSFETTFSPFISPNDSQEGTVKNSMTQGETNILSWNPESPINEIQSLYNSSNRRNQQNEQNHEVKPDELIEKMTSLSREKERKQRKMPERKNFGISSMEFMKKQTKHQQHKVNELIEVPRLKPLSRFTYQTQKDGRQSTSPSEDRVLNLSFEDGSLYKKGTFLNKKLITSSGKLEIYKGGLKGFK